MKIIIDKNGFVDIQNQEKHQGQNSNDYLRLEFEFAEEWNEYNKFLNWKGKDLEEDGCLIENNLFLIPKTISEHQEVEFNVFFKKTVDENTIQTPSEKWNMYFEPSIDSNPSQIEKHKDVIDQLVEKAEDLQEEKVDKEEGKGLSSNDFTDEYKEQVDSNTEAIGELGQEVASNTQDIDNLERVSHTHDNKNVLDNTTASYTTEEKNKLAELENYDDTDVKRDIANIKAEQTTQNNAIETNRSGIATNATNIQAETTNRQNADLALQNQIDAITSASDVVDVVSSYSDLQNYDTSKLTADDVIKVMRDSSHNEAISYFRWVIENNSGSWSYVGSEGPFFTKGETLERLNQKQNVIDNANKLNSDLVDDTNNTHKFVTTEEKEVWNNKIGDTDYATDNTGGVFKTGSTYGTYLYNGMLACAIRTIAQYENANNGIFISKGTLENVLAEKIGDLETALTNLNQEAEAI